MFFSETQCTCTECFAIQSTTSVSEADFQSSTLKQRRTLRVRRLGSIIPDTDWLTAVWSVLHRTSRSISAGSTVHVSCRISAVVT